jgi:hypothetical protein
LRLHEVFHKIKRGFSFINSTDLKKAYGLSAICFGFFVMWGLFRGRSSLNNLFGAAYYIGWLFGTGLPIIIIASLLFCSKLTQRKIVSTTIHDDGDFVSLYLPYLIITLLVMSVGAIAGFCLVVTTSGVFEALLYSPQLLVSTLFLTLLVCPICVLLALVLDDKKLSIAIGIILFFSLTIATGTPGFPVNYPEVAFLGPGILLSAILFVLIGGIGSYSSDWYVGLHFSEIQLVIPILVWIAVSIISIWGASKIYSLNIKRWIAESNQWSTAEAGDEGKPSNITILHDELKRRRKTVTAFAFAFMLVIPVSSTVYVSSRQEEWRKVVYETPAGGLSVEVGEWLYGAFTGIDAPENIHLAVGCEGEILQGGGSAPYIEYTFDHRQMSLNELLQLNETEFEDTFGRSWGRNSGTSTTFHSGRGGPIHDDQYVWVLKLIDIGGQTDGSIRVSFRVVISAT